MDRAADAHRLIEQLYDELDKRNLNRDTIRELTDEISTMVMIQAEPEVDMSLRDIGFSPAESEIVNFMRCRLGKVVRKDVLANCYKRNNPRGERDDPDNCIGVHVCKIRKKLKQTELPYRIETIRPSGYRMFVA